MPPFRPNPRFGAEVRKQPAYRATLVEAAGAVRDQAAQLADAVQAPWMRRAGADTIEVDATGEDVAVVNRDFGGHLMEFGGRNNPPHAPLRRGVQAAGLRLDEHPQT